MTVSNARWLPVLSVAVRPESGQLLSYKGSAGSARRCCYHCGYRVQDPKRRDLSDLPRANRLRNLHGLLLRRRFLLAVVAKSADDDVAAEHEKEQQRGTRQRRTQP